jgi:hypothetical protein
MKALLWFMALFGLTAGGNSSAAAPANPTTPEHAVVVHFQYGARDLQRLFALEKKLEAAIVSAGVGEFDGNDVAADGSDGYLYMYGPNADRLFETIKPILEATQFMRGAKIKLRYGPPQVGSSERVVVISP